MIFTAPIPFKEALDSLRAKSLLPTTGLTADLEKLPAEIRERARFSAGVYHGEILSKYDQLVEMMVAPEQNQSPGAGISDARFREEMRVLLRSIGYEPDPDKRGGMQDLSSRRRLDLMRDMAVAQARNYGYFEQGQDEVILDNWPAQELFRAEDRMVERDWISRWENARGRLGDSTSALDARIAMVALKNDPIWTAISRFGLPYPPFDFNSGMDVRDITRQEAEELGVIAPNAPAPDPEHRPFTADLELSADELQRGLLDELLDSMDGIVELVNGILRFKEAA